MKPGILEVSADSHPFWTGARRTLDTAGRVERFNRRYGQRPLSPKAK
ncbi:50S ribosomal protein L31 [Mycobacterium simulans]|uniref:50S ribosomal protein L31 n=1 Tax=Mycobacterium simulans TaxID=627089 RepID=A0A7Z7IL70_9MYCO|nr:50S ribosomal protein L31 [Mycobacterium simulans]